MNIINFLCNIHIELPYNDYFEYFGPDFKLHIQPSNMQNQNTTEYLDKINKCIIENTAAEGTIALNSFSAEILQDLHQRAKNANSIDELEFLLNQVYQTTNCEP